MFSGGDHHSSGIGVKIGILNLFKAVTLDGCSSFCRQRKDMDMWELIVLYVPLRRINIYIYI